MAEKKWMTEMKLQRVNAHRVSFLTDPVFTALALSACCLLYTATQKLRLGSMTFQFRKWAEMISLIYSKIPMEPNGLPTPTPQIHELNFKLFTEWTDLRWNWTQHWRETQTKMTKTRGEGPDQKKRKKKRKLWPDHDMKRSKPSVTSELCHVVCLFRSCWLLGCGREV